MSWGTTNQKENIMFTATKTSITLTAIAALMMSATAAEALPKLTSCKVINFVQGGEGTHPASKGKTTVNFDINVNNGAATLQYRSGKLWPKSTPKSTYTAEALKIVVGKYANPNRKACSF
jgi:hypothetical protein